jgi:bifunctional enzyme CysN/CysC
MFGIMRMNGGLSENGAVGNRGVAGRRVRSGIGRPRSEAATDVVEPESSVQPEERFGRHGHTGGVFWLTGLPSAGKSTVALAAQRMLFDRGRHVYVLDGGTLRTSLNVDLGFSEEDRAENVRRVAAAAAVLADGGFVVICALISPFAEDRAKARASYPACFHEIYVACDLETAEKRDTKGRYKRARLGQIPGFTGVSSPYEVPVKPELTIDTTKNSVRESAAYLMEYIERMTRP